MVYDTVTHLFYFFGGEAGGNYANETWAYNPRTKAFTIKCQATGCVNPPAVNGGGPINTDGVGAIAYNTIDHMIYERDRLSSGCQTHKYNPQTDMWSTLTDSGTPLCSIQSYLGFDGSTTGSHSGSAGRLIIYGTSAGDNVVHLDSGVLSGGSTFSAQLEVREALYAGDQTGTSYGGTATNGLTGGGIARTNEPFCMGVPIPDNTLSLANLTILGLTGNVSAGQFRSLGTWPSGNIKWLKVCGILSSLGAGGTQLLTLTNGGSGNFGGPNLASIASGTITVATGTATFTIKAVGNFNGVDTVTMGSTGLVTTSAAQTRGLVLMGPNPTATYPANVTCGTGTGQSPCTTIYSSANDPSSSCTIEENGPVMAVIRCVGLLMDNASHPYMPYTWRGTFYQNRSSVKAQMILRNANYDTAHTPSNDYPGNTFDTAFKGYASLEHRVGLNVSGTLTYTLATDSAGTQVGTIASTDSAYVYQGKSNYMNTNQHGSCLSGGIGSACGNSYTQDIGYVAKKNTTTLASDTTGNLVIGGWADVHDTSGNGVEIGIYQMPAYWPASLEFYATGADTRIGLRSAQNGVISGTAVPQYQGWPRWDIFDYWMSFHTATPSTPANDFLSYQHYLLMRPTSIPYINSTNVWTFPILDPSVEDSYMVGLPAVSTCLGCTNQVTLSKVCYGGGTINCTPDYGVIGGYISNGIGIEAWRSYDWGDGGGFNQEEQRLSHMIRYFQRGMTGDFIDTAQFERYEIAKNLIHADGSSATDSTVNGFKWSSRPPVQAYYWTTPGTPELDTGGTPTATSANSTLGKWTGQGTDSLHDHSSGAFDYYDLTGEEWVKEGVLGKKGYYLNNDTIQADEYATQFPPFASGCCTNFFHPGYGGASGGFQAPRGNAMELMNTGRFAEFLSSIGDSDATGVLLQGQINFDNFVNHTGCLNGYPAGCNVPNVNTGANDDPQGLSFERGVFQGARTAVGWCASSPGTIGSESGLNGAYRLGMPYQQAMLARGLLEFRHAEGLLVGTSSPRYDRALDIAYGVSQFAYTEGYNFDNSAYWLQVDAAQKPTSINNGFRYDYPTDIAAACPGTSPVSGTTTANLNGTVSTSGTAVTSLTGTGFYSPQLGWMGGVIWINGTNYTISSVTDTTHLTLTTSAGTNASVPYKWDPELLFLPTGANPSTQTFDLYSMANAEGMVWYTLYVDQLVNGTLNATDKKKMQFAQDIMAYYSSGWHPDFGTIGYNAAIGSFTSPSTNALQDIAISNFTNLGGGSYSFSFTPPAGTCTTPHANCLRIKWSPKIIVNSGGASTNAYNAGGLLGFDSLYTQTFSLSPATYATWFAANNTVEPTATPGTQMTFTCDATHGCPSGTPTTLTAANFSVKAMFPAGCSISPTTLGPWTSGQTIDTTLTAVGCATSAWAVSSGSLPTGLSLNSSSGVITGTISAAGTFSPTVSYGTGSEPYTITVNTAPSINTSSLPSGTLGTAYIQTLSTSGGTAPLTCSISSGSLPTGLSISSGCVISGTPSVAGSFSFTATVTDANAVAGNRALSIIVNLPANGALFSSGGVFSGAVVIR